MTFASTPIALSDDDLEQVIGGAAGPRFTTEGGPQFGSFGPGNMGVSMAGIAPEMAGALVAPSSTPFHVPSLLSGPTLPFPGTAMVPPSYSPVAPAPDATGNSVMPALTPFYVPSLLGVPTMPSPGTAIAPPTFSPSAHAAPPSEVEQFSGKPGLQMATSDEKGNPVCIVQ